MNVIDRAGPYVEQLLHNDAARTDLRRAVGTAGGLYLAADESAHGRLTKRLRDAGAGSAASDTTSAEGTP